MRSKEAGDNYHGKSIWFVYTMKEFYLAGIVENICVPFATSRNGFVSVSFEFLDRCNLCKVLKFFVTTTLSVVSYILIIIHRTIVVAVVDTVISDTFWAFLVKKMSGNI